MNVVPLPLAQIALSALNHVLAQQDWARDRLRAHAGRSVRVVVVSPLGPVSSDARIGDDGSLAAAAVEAPTVTLTLTPSIDAVFGVLREGTRGLSGHLKIDGDVMVAAAIGEIAQQLRWDVEEDLSRVLGDRAAHRMGEAARQGARQAREAGERAESGVRRFLVDEDPQLVGRTDMRALAAAIRSLDDAVGRLEARLGPAARR